VECAVLAPEPLGLDVDLTALVDGVEVGAPAVLFGEDQGRAVVSAAPEHRDAVLALARRHGVPTCVVGTVGAARGQVRFAVSGHVVERSAERLRGIYADAIPRRLNGADGTRLAPGA